MYGGASNQSSALGAVADQTALIGTTYVIGWSYSGIDPSCNQLRWTFTSTMPNTQPTFSPTLTSLSGTETISFQIATTTPVSQYSNVATAAKIVGQFVALEASPQPAATTFSWLLSGRPISSYKQSVQSAAYTPWGTQSDVSAQITKFYFYLPSSSSTPAPQQLETTWPTNWGDPWGNQFVLAKTQVNSLTNVVITATKGKVFATPSPQLQCEPSLVFGIANQGGSLCNSLEAPGITWSFTATAPTQIGGALDATQLVSGSNSMAPLPGATGVPTPAPAPTATQLDTCIHYGMGFPPTHATMKAGLTATWTSNDSPGAALDPLWLSYLQSNDFTTFFVFRPDDISGTPLANQNIWVVLGHAHWSWSGTAVQATPAPSPTATPIWKLGPASARVSTDKNPGPLPTWNSAFIPKPMPCPPGG